MCVLLLHSVIMGQRREAVPFLSAMKYNSCLMRVEYNINICSCQ